MSTLRLSLLIGCFVATAAASRADLPPADLIVRGVVIHTVDAEQPRADAFAVKEGVFVAVGDAADVERYRGAATRVLDLPGRTVVPGFNDAHLHPRPLFPEDSPWAEVDASPAQVRTIEELVAALRRKAAVTPPGQWITAHRYQETKLGRHPTRQDLDTASTDHPISVSHSSGHQSVVNSHALRLAGITRDTPDPAGGHVVRDVQGEPTGRLQESAQRLVSGVRAVRTVKPPRAETIKALRRRVEQYAARGITSIGVAGGSAEAAELLAEALGDAPLLRVYWMLRESEVDEAVRRQREGATDFLRFGAIKLFHGNSLSGQTCWLDEPYAHRANYYGVPPARSQQALNELILSIHRAGLQACVHSNGDREIAMVLTAIEHAQREHPRAEARHRIEHCSIVNAALVARIKAAGVIPVPHAYLWEHGDKHEAYGEERWEWMHAARAFLDAGIPVAGHSDAPVAEAHALLRIQDMVTRKSAEGKVYGASQRISPAEALRIWTLGGAYASFEEDRKGSIAVGKWADFVVLAADPLATPEEKLKDIVVEQTFVGGREVFAAPGL